MSRSSAKVKVKYEGQTLKKKSGHFGDISVSETQLVNIWNWIDQ